MELQQRRILKSKAKSYLSNDEYKKFALALKTFCKTKDIEKLCNELRAIICHNSETSEIIQLTRQFLPENRRIEFMAIMRQLEIGNQGENDDPNRPSNRQRSEHSISPGNALTSRHKNVKRFITMERSSLQIDFGFRIKGDLFIKQEIIVGKVDSGSIAEMSGLQEGVRLVSVNSSKFKRARKADLIQLVKNSLRLCLEVMILNEGVQSVEEATASVKYISVCSNESGWLGLSIRGGSDYGCDICITSIDNDSPAEKAGLHVGDIIKEVNGVKLHDKTHIQAVEQIVATCPPITFAIHTNKDRNTAIQASHHRCSQPRTPLRIVSSSRPVTARVTHEWHTTDWVSDTAHGIDSLYIQGSPPPPYSAELPELHRVFQKSSDQNGTCYTDNQPVDHIYDDVENVLNVEPSMLYGLSDGSNGYCGNSQEARLCNFARPGISPDDTLRPLIDHVYGNVENARNGRELSVTQHRRYSTAESDCESYRPQLQGAVSNSDNNEPCNEHIYDEVYADSSGPESLMPCNLSVTASHVHHEYRDTNTLTCSNLHHVQQNHGNHGDDGNYSNDGNHGNNDNQSNSGCHGNDGNQSNSGYHGNDGNQSNGGYHGNNGNQSDSGYHGSSGNHGNSSSHGNDGNNCNHSDTNYHSNNSNHGTCSSATTQSSSLLGEIQNFKNSILRKAQCPPKSSSVAANENETRKQEHDNLLGVINAAIVSRARVFESSIVSSNDSCDSLSEWD